MDYRGCYVDITYDESMSNWEASLWYDGSMYGTWGFPEEEYQTQYSVREAMESIVDQFVSEFNW